MQAEAWVLRVPGSPWFYDRSLPNLVYIESDPLHAGVVQTYKRDEVIASYADRVEGLVGERAPACECCGVTRYHRFDDDGNAHDHEHGLERLYARKQMFYRCGKHRDRNPCAVDGCARTTDAKGWLANDGWLCGEHWKIACPPGSPSRRVYNRLFALHRKEDGKGKPWSPVLNRRYWRVMGAIVLHARAATAGDLDMKTINEMFGWE